MDEYRKLYNGFKLIQNFYCCRLISKYIGKLGFKLKYNKFKKSMKSLMSNPDNHNYGINKILLALKQKGENPSRSIVIRTINKGNLIHEIHRKPAGLTRKDKKAQQPENIVNHDFTGKEDHKK